MREVVKLKANKPSKIQLQGKVLQIVDCGVAGSVSIKIAWARTSQPEDYGFVSNKFVAKSEGPSTRFDSFTLEATVDTSVDLIASDQDARFDSSSGTSIVQLDPTTLPLPINIAAQAAPVTVKESGAEVATYHNPVAVTAVAAVAIAAGAYKRVTIYNAGPNPVGISRGVTTFAKCAIVLGMGDAYIEERFAANAQDFHAICDAGLNATIAVESYA